MADLPQRRFEEIAGYQPGEPMFTGFASQLISFDMRQSDQNQQGEIVRDPIVASPIYFPRPSA
jgi:hypothetical protein